MKFPAWKSLIKSAALTCGYEIRKIQPMPPGKDWITDLSRLAGPAPVIFDVGANIGEISLRLAHTLPPQSRIFAFEPSAATFARLTATVCAHPQVTPLRMALSDSVGSTKLYHGINSQLNRLAPVGALGLDTYEDVQSETIDSIAAQLGISRIDALKTDTEGFDAAVLRGASDMLGRGMIGAVVSEITFDSESSWHTRFDDIRGILTPYGYHLHGVYDGTLWGTHLKYCNVMFVRDELSPSRANS
jgi:FkbM family methyltransferase